MGEEVVQYAMRALWPVARWRNRPIVGAKWLFARSGPCATNHFEAGGFVRSNVDVEYPNLMFHFLPLAIRYDGGTVVRDLPDEVAAALPADIFFVGLHHGSHASITSTVNSAKR